MCKLNSIGILFGINIILMLVSCSEGFEQQKTGIVEEYHDATKIFLLNTMTPLNTATPRYAGILQESTSMKIQELTPTVKIEYLSDPIVNIDDGYIVYTRTMKYHIPNYNDIFLENKLFIMSSQGQDIALLDTCKADITLLRIPIGWKDDGTILAVGCDNKIILHDIRDPEYFRVLTLDYSGEPANLSSPVPEIELTNICSSITHLVWQKDNDSIIFICNDANDKENKLFCKMEMKFNIEESIYGNEYLSAEKEKVECSNLSSILKDEAYYIYSFKRSPKENDIMISYKNMKSTTQTIIFHINTGQIEFLFPEIGTGWSPDGKRITIVDNFDNYDRNLCLLEYNSEENVVKNLYCPPEKISETSYLYSLEVSFETDYSSDGKYLLFVASPLYVGEYMHLGIYRLNLQTNEIGLLTVWGDGNAVNPQWQPLCASCKK